MIVRVQTVAPSREPKLTLANIGGRRGTVEELLELIREAIRPAIISDVIADNSGFLVYGEEALDRELLGRIAPRGTLFVFMRAVKKSASRRR